MTSHRVDDSVIRPIIDLAQRDSLRAYARFAVSNYRGRIRLDAIDAAITAAMAGTNDTVFGTAPMGAAHERLVLWALGWFAAVVRSLSETDARSVSRRLLAIERIVADLVDAAAQQAEGPTQ